MYRKPKECEKENHFNNNAIKSKEAFSLERIRQAADQKKKKRDGGTKIERRGCGYGDIIHSCGEQLIIKPCTILRIRPSNFYVSRLVGKPTLLFCVLLSCKKKLLWKRYGKNLHITLQRLPKTKKKQLIFKNIKSRHDLMIIYLKFKISTITCK